MTSCLSWFSKWVDRPTWCPDGRMSSSDPGSTVHAVTLHAIYWVVEIRSAKGVILTLRRSHWNCPEWKKIQTDPLVKTRPKKSFEILYDKIDQSSQLQATLANPTSFCWQPKWLYGGRSGKSMHLQPTRRNQGTRQSWRQDQKSLGP